jgi:hypothetical protein
MEYRLVDLPQSHDPDPLAKGVEEAHIRGAMAMAQAGKVAPRALLGQQPGQQIERMHWRQQCQQMHAPELGRTELPARATNRTCVPMCVDEVIGNEWIKQVEQLVGTGHGKALHGAQGYPFGNAASAFCFPSQFSAR